MSAARARDAPEAVARTAPRNAARGRKSKAEKTSVVSTFSLPIPPPRYLRALPSQEISSSSRPIADGGTLAVTRATVFVGWVAICRRWWAVTVRKPT